MPIQSSLVKKTYDELSSFVQKYFREISDIVNKQDLPWLDVYTTACLDFESIIGPVVPPETYNFMLMEYNGDCLSNQKNKIRDIILNTIIAQLTKDIRREFFINKDNQFELKICPDCHNCVNCNGNSFTDYSYSANVKGGIIFTLKITVYNDFRKWNY